MKKKRQQKQREKRLYYCKLQLKNVEWTWRKPFTFRFRVTHTHTHTHPHAHTPTRKPQKSLTQHKNAFNMSKQLLRLQCERERGKECELTSKAKDWWQRFSFSFGRGQSSHCVYAKVKHDENAPRCLIKNALRAVWSCIQHRGTNTRKHRGTNTHTGTHTGTHTVPHCGTAISSIRRFVRRFIWVLLMLRKKDFAQQQLMMSSRYCYWWTFKEVNETFSHRS